MPQVQFSNLTAGLGNFNSPIYGGGGGDDDDPQPPGTFSWKVQLLGIQQNNPDSALAYLAAWLDSSGWHPGGLLVGQSANTRNLQLVTGNGNLGYLQVVALGPDGIGRLLAYQNVEGTWFASPVAGGASLFSSGATPCTQLALCPGNELFLQLLGLGRDGFVYLMNWLDGSGNWHPIPAPGLKFAGQSTPYTQMLAVPGNSQYIQVIGLGARDGLAYLVAWQDSEGNWHSNDGTWYQGGQLPGQTTPCKQLVPMSREIVAADGGVTGSELNIVGLGAQDGQPYLMGLQDNGGGWHPGRRLAIATPFYQLGGFTSVTGLAEADHTPYVAATLHQDGTWAPGIGIDNPNGYRYAQILGCADASSRYFVLGLNEVDWMPYVIATFTNVDPVWRPGPAGPLAILFS